MKKLLDKLVILIITLALYLLSANNVYLIVPVLIAISLSAILSYFEGEALTTIVFLAYIVACLIEPTFLFFIPLICYDVIFHKIKELWVLAFLPLFMDLLQRQVPLNWLIAALILVVYLLKHRTIAIQRLEVDYNRLRDNTKEISMQLEKQNKDLLEKQDYEINLATVTERNRIARDIHDNVGHLLSRSILQIGALLAINKDDQTKADLKLIKNTLSEAMDSIRTNVHNLHEESISLKTEIQKLIDGFRFCTIKFDYDVETNPERNIKYCFIAVTKEALSNIIKHSNGTEASVKIHEHPALYQLVIQDNGSRGSYNSENGIGIKSITDRVASVDGNVNISTDNGFRIFISIPKK